ncbi:Zn-ribbon domain-containing OB-fold protein [Nocardia sienata]|uniref:Zn-ribbon domain-containing OB-fold protein n=1 Tax=Nocardia sienata TaxID=248552 RepID=UPI0007A4847D|nr:OB-fold domain-containing protein [Nocardia sienata]
MGEQVKPVLEGSRCRVCGTVGYPASAICARCARPTADPLPLGDEGVVWAYTVQRFPPKSPPYVVPAEGFTPYAVGYVELPEGIKIEAILDCDEFTALDRAPVRLVAVTPVPRFATTTTQQSEDR